MLYSDLSDQVTVQNKKKAWRGDFQMCSFWCIEHVDRFVGMAGTSSSCENETSPSLAQHERVC